MEKVVGVRGRERLTLTMPEEKIRPAHRKLCMHYMCSTYSINTHAVTVAVCVCCPSAVVVVVQPNGEHETRARSQALPHTCAHTHAYWPHTHTASSALAHFTRGCPAFTLPAHTHTLSCLLVPHCNAHTHVGMLY